MTGVEVCGHLDIKVTSKGRKFGQWKAWRRLWCVVRCGKGNSVQLIVGNNYNSPTSCIDIPYNAVVCRSESRSRPFAFGVFCCNSEYRLRQPIVFLAGHSETESQQWMLKIRNVISPPKIPVEKEEFSISLIDNAYSKTAGLTGLYGTLRTIVSGLTVSDPGTGLTRTHWRWSHLQSITVDTGVLTEDKGHVVVLLTSSEFPSAEGELRIFSLEGEALTRVLSRYLSRPPHRLTCSPLPPLPKPSLLALRRLSRSEGDLRCWPQDGSLESLFHLRTQSVSRHDKVANGLITAGLGLIMTTPGSSEPDSLHDYQCLDSHWPALAQEDTLSDLPDSRRQRFADSGRRESEVSVASGIYAEITEKMDHCYEPTSCNIPRNPPPLPPRECKKYGLGGEEEECKVPDESFVYSVVEDSKDEPHYLPMSPRGKQEDTYVVMANIINQTNHGDSVT